MNSSESISEQGTQKTKIHDLKTAFLVIAISITGSACAIHLYESEDWIGLLGNGVFCGAGFMMFWNMLANHTKWFKTD